MAAACLLQPFQGIADGIAQHVPKILVRNGVFVGLDENLTIFIGEKQADKQIGQVFIQDTRQPDKIVTYTAGNGRFALQEGRQMLILEQGQRTEISREGGNSALLEFDSHALDISRSTVQQINQRALDSNEENVFALFRKTVGLTQKYVAERKAQAHYRDYRADHVPQPQPVGCCDAASGAAMPGLAKKCGWRGWCWPALPCR